MYSKFNDSFFQANSRRWWNYGRNCEQRQAERNK